MVYDDNSVEYKTLSLMSVI